MVPSLLAGRISRAERIRQRCKVDLEDAALTEKTRVRYYNALRKLLPTVERCPATEQLDEYVCEWIHKSWKKGEPLLTIGDALSALHFFQPTTRRLIPHSWKLFKVWRKIEVPARAPPLTWALVTSMTAYCLDTDKLELACVLMLAFHCLLRTGEALAVTADDLMLGPTSGICRLQGTKSGKRNAANEVISVTSLAVLDILRALQDIRTTLNIRTAPLWSQSPAAFRQAFKKLLCRFGLEAQGFRPYSLRRGGATDLFQRTGSMELSLLRGRWESSRVARIYIADGLSYLPSLRLSAHTRNMLHRYAL